MLIQTKPLKLIVEISSNRDCEGTNHHGITNFQWLMLANWRRLHEFGSKTNTSGSGVAWEGFLFLHELTVIHSRSCSCSHKNFSRSQWGAPLLQRWKYTSKQAPMKWRRLYTLKPTYLHETEKWKWWSLWNLTWKPAAEPPKQDCSIKATESSIKRMV